MLDSIRENPARLAECFVPHQHVLTKDLLLTQFNVFYTDDPPSEKEEKAYKFLCHRKDLCYFVVWSEVNMHIECILFDQEFCDEIFLTATNRDLEHCMRSSA